MSEISDLITTYRTTTDDTTRNVTADAIRRVDEIALYALIDEEVARGQINRLSSIGQSTKSCEIRLANALALIEEVTESHQRERERV